MGKKQYVKLSMFWNREAFDFSKVDGLTWKGDDGTVVTNKARRILNDLDSLAYPAWHLFPYHKYGLLPFADFANQY